MILELLGIICFIVAMFHVNTGDWFSWMILGYLFNIMGRIGKK